MASASGYKATRGAGKQEKQIRWHILGAVARDYQVQAAVVVNKDAGTLKQVLTDKSVFACMHASVNLVMVSTAIWSPVHYTLHD